MKNSKAQKEITKAWTKMELNSSYYPKGQTAFTVYDKTIADKITEEGKKNLMVLEEALKNVL